MTRLGWLLLLAFLVVIGGFALILRKGRPGAAPPPSHAAPAPSPERSADRGSAGGGLAIPVRGVEPGQLVDTWGDARGDGTRAHHAIDIPAARGTPVIAAAAGTVEKIFESANGGHTVYVRRDDPAWVDYYAHLDAYAPGLAEGLTVKRGQVIGAVGSSGDADPQGPHLHYEIKRMAPGERWYQGIDTDPYPLLTGAR